MGTLVKQRPRNAIINFTCLESKERKPASLRVSYLVEWVWKDTMQLMPLGFPFLSLKVVIGFSCLALNKPPDLVQKSLSRSLEC